MVISMVIVLVLNILGKLRIIRLLFLQQLLHIVNTILIQPFRFYQARLFLFKFAEVVEVHRIYGHVQAEHPIPPMALGLQLFTCQLKQMYLNPLISTVPCFYLSVTETALPSSSPTCTPSQTVIPTLSPSLTGTISSMTPTPTISMAESASSTPTPTMTPSPSPTGTVTVTISLTGTVTPILTPQASQEVSVTPSSTNTATVTVSETPTVTPSETPSVTPSISSSDSATSTLTVSVSSTLSPLSTDLGAGENIPKNQVGRNGFTVGEIGGITAGCIVCFVALLAFVSVVRSSSKKPLKSLHAKPNQFGEQVMMNGVLNSRVISVQVKETSRQDRIRSALDSRKGRL